MAQVCYASACALRVLCELAAAASQPAIRTAEEASFLSNKGCSVCGLEVPQALDCVGRFGGRVAAALLEGLVKSGLRPVLDVEAPELQSAARYSVLAGVGQRARQVLEELQGAQSSNGEPNRGSQ